MSVLSTAMSGHSFSVLSVDRAPGTVLVESASHYKRSAVACKAREDGIAMIIPTLLRGPADLLQPLGFCGGSF